MIRYFLFGFALVLVALPAGCIELQAALQGALPGPAGTGPPVTNGDDQPDDQPGESVPTVRLQVSNPSPQVDEEVTLTCSVVSGDSAGVTYAFQPANGRLFINHATGTATFIVEESDVEVAFTFTCTATSEAGTSQPSNQQVIIATS